MALTVTGEFDGATGVTPGGMEPGWQIWFHRVSVQKLNWFQVAAFGTLVARSS